MELALRVFLEAVMGYLLQMISFVVGMHAIAKQKMDLKRAALVSVVCAVATFLIRSSDLFNFGVHTMLMLLVINAVSIFVCSMPVRASILGSIVMMILVLVSELINMGILNIFYSSEEINRLLADATFKAASAIPGNLVLLLISILMYKLRSKSIGEDKSESGE